MGLGLVLLRKATLGPVPSSRLLGRTPGSRGGCVIVPETSVSECPESFTISAVIFQFTKGHCMWIISKEGGKKWEFGVNFPRPSEMTGFDPQDHAGPRPDP